MSNYIYLDNAATTRVREEVLCEMLPYFAENYGNASSQHKAGRDALKGVDEARKKVADAIGAKSNEIYFTSGGTESDAWAVRGVAYEYKNKGRHIISTVIEHPAIKNNLEQLEKEGFAVTYLPVDKYGIVDVEAVRGAIKSDTILITVMAANNEIGSIQPIEAIGKIARENKILFHTDAVQAVGTLPLCVNTQNIDLMSLSAHKFYGAKGIGALYIRNGVKLEKFMLGGGQERTMRSGTLNVSSIVSLGAAISLAIIEMKESNAKLEKMRNMLIEGIEKEIPNAILNGHRTNRLVNNASFSFAHIEAEGILLMLDMAGIGVSSGSACSSGSLKGSYVLSAIGVPEGLAQGTIRFTFGRYNTMEDVEYVVEKLKGIVERLRLLSPLGKNKN